MFNLKKTSAFLLAAFCAAGFVACEEDGDYTIPRSEVEEIVPRSEVVEQTDIDLGGDNPNAIAMGGTFTLTALAPESVNRVEFYNDGVQIGEDDTAPFTIELAPFASYNILAKGFTDGVESGQDEASINIGLARYPVSSGTLTGDGNEVFNSDGPEGENYPADRKYAAMINVGGPLADASGVNVPVNIPEAGEYMVSMGLASGWADEESFVRFYFDDDEANVQRSPAVPADGWLAFADYELPEPFTLTAGEHVAKMRFGGPWVHTYYIDIYPAEEGGE